MMVIIQKGHLCSRAHTNGRLDSSVSLRRDHKIRFHLGMWPCHLTPVRFEIHSRAILHDLRLDLSFAAGGRVQAVQLALLHVAPEALQDDVSGEVGRRAGQNARRGNLLQDLETETAEERESRIWLGRLRAREAVRFRLRS